MDESLYTRINLTGKEVMALTLYMSTVFVAGLLSFFAPCTYALMPAYIGVLSDASKNAFETFLRTACFVMGLGVTFITLGFGVGAVGQLLQLDSFYWVMGTIVLLMGLHQMDILRISFLERYLSTKFRRFKGHHYFTAFWIGLTFSFAWTPCVGPVLGAVLVVAAQSSQVFYGAWLMLLYTMGLAVPFIIIAMLSNVVVKHMGAMEKYLIPIKRLGGLLIVFMGILIITRQLQSFTLWFERLL